MAELKPHLSLNVTDISSSVAFYTALFGTEPVTSKPGYAKFEIDDPRFNLSLNESPAVANHGAFNHAGIQVDSTEAVLAAKARLTSAGLAIGEACDCGTTGCACAAEGVSDLCCA